MAVTVDGDISFLLQQAQRTADGGFGITKVVAHIDGADVVLPLQQNMDGFQIHLAGFMKFHRQTSLLFSDYTTDSTCGKAARKFFQSLLTTAGPGRIICVVSRG
jgi:hypothetical protein